MIKREIKPRFNKTFYHTNSIFQSPQLKKTAIPPFKLQNPLEHNIIIQQSPEKQRYNKNRMKTEPKQNYTIVTAVQRKRNEQKCQFQNNLLEFYEQNIQKNENKNKLNRLLATDITFLDIGNQQRPALVNQNVKYSRQFEKSMRKQQIGSYLLTHQKEKPKLFIFKQK